MKIPTSKKRHLRIGGYYNIRQCTRARDELWGIRFDNTSFGLMCVYYYVLLQGVLVEQHLIVVGN